MEIRFYLDPSTGLPHIGGHGVEEHEVEDALESVEGAPSTTEKETMKQQAFPPGWDEERVRRVLEHYEAQTDEQAVAEDEAAYESTTHTMVAVPVDLVPSVRELISKKTR